MDGNKKIGSELIAIERQRQIKKEGWTSKHDDQYINGELAKAAVCYATPPEIDLNAFFTDNRVVLWPWIREFESWKPSPDDRIRELVKAGALIAAEIDRLLRALEEGE